METYKYFVHDDSHKIKDKLFDSVEEAYDYAQNGLITFISKIKFEDGNEVEEDEEIIWTWDDTRSKDEFLDSLKEDENKNISVNIEMNDVDPEKVEELEAKLVDELSRFIYGDDFDQDFDEPEEIKVDDKFVEPAELDVEDGFDQLEKADVDHEKVLDNIFETEEEKELDESLSLEEFNRMMTACEKLGFTKMSDVEKFAEEHGDLKDQDLLAALEKEAAKDELAELEEDTHDRYAKPEGDKVASYNNAKKYADKYGKAFCYGYTNRRLGGKFFAFEQPFEWDGDDNKFRAQYKNCGTIYVAYPSKPLTEEQREPKVGDKVKIIDMADEPEYEGKEGTITSIDGLGQLHGTWGGLAIIPEIDLFEIVEEKPAEEKDLEEHVNEEHPAIESDQVLHGNDNAVVDCQTDQKVITHSEDEKPLDCKMEKAPLEKPLAGEKVFEEVEDDISDEEFLEGVGNILIQKHSRLEENKELKEETLTELFGFGKKQKLDKEDKKYELDNYVKQYEIKEIKWNKETGKYEAGKIITVAKLEGAYETAKSLSAKPGTEQVDIKILKIADNKYKSLLEKPICARYVQGQVKDNVVGKLLNSIKAIDDEEEIINKNADQEYKDRQSEETQDKLNKENKLAKEPEQGEQPEENKPKDKPEEPEQEAKKQNPAVKKHRDMNNKLLAALEKSSAPKEYLDKLKALDSSKVRAELSKLRKELFGESLEKNLMSENQLKEESLNEAALTSEYIKKLIDEYIELYSAVETDEARDAIDARLELLTKDYDSLSAAEQKMKAEK